MHNRLEICGGIASGKTSLAKLLAEHNIANPIYENFQSNPFWEAFYTDIGKYIFETELTFTLQHYHDIKKQAHQEKLLVCDYSTVLDIAYAKIGLGGNKLKIFEQMTHEICQDIGKPKAIIYLQCSPEEELKRIKKRARNIEKNITINFLDSLNFEIQKNILLTKNIKIIDINSQQYDFVNNQGHQILILDRVKMFLSEAVDRMAV